MIGLAESIKIKKEKQMKNKGRTSHEYRKINGNFRQLYRQSARE